MASKKYESYINLSPDALLALPAPLPPKLIRTKRSYGIPKDDDGNGNNTEFKNLHYNVTGKRKLIIKRPLARPRRKGDTKKLKNITDKRRSKSRSGSKSRTRTRSRSGNTRRSRSGNRTTSKSIK